MKKIMYLVVIMTFLSVALAGCGQTDGGTEEPYNAAIVLGISNNNSYINADSIEVLNAIPGIAESTYSIIECDGSPYEICSGQIKDFSDYGYTSAMLERIEASVLSEINESIRLTQPRTDEVDVGAATTLAVRAIHANQQEGHRDILIYAMSGLSTTGIIDMTSISLSELDVEESAARAASELNMDMTGIIVQWYFIGDTAGTQPSLSAGEVTLLKSFYETLFLRLGAQSVTFFDDLPSTNESYDFEQDVSIVETEGMRSVLSQKVTDAGEMENTEDVEAVFGSDGMILFSEASVSFLPDSTSLADPTAAADALSCVIDYMKADPDFELLICGQTASVGTQQSCIAFSGQRADAVKEVLSQEGIEEERIHVLGCGYTNEVVHVQDRDEDGNLDEEAASLNRSVLLLDYNSDLASQILAAQ